MLPPNNSPEAPPITFLVSAFAVDEYGGAARLLSLGCLNCMRRGFTLTELLVTVAIIGVLAALLLPVLGRARVTAERATCINNLHQISTALVMYSDDHAGFLRAATNDSYIYFTYREDINGYLSPNGSSTNDSTFTCPADRFDCTASPN